MMRFRKTWAFLLVCCLLLGAAEAMAEHTTHKWGPWEVTKQPTCTDSGESRRVCQTDGCGAVENDYNNPPKLGHKMGPFTLTTAATCTTEGIETSHCERCSYTETRTIPKLNHQMTGWILKEVPTCTKDGLQENKCVTCDTQTQTQIVPKKGHTWADWYPTTPATCDAGGTATRVCSTCGEKETKSLDALGHNYGSWITDVAPTCIADGTLKRVCSRCGKVETKSADKLGHNYGLWTENKKATCSVDGEKSRICSRCGDKQTTPIPKLGKNQPNGHTFGSWGDKVNPTCTKEGSEKRTCSACGRVETRAIAKLPHKSDGVWVDKREATTKQMGLQVTHCTECGAIASQRNVAPRNFKYEVPTYAYGPLASEFPGGASTARLIYLDLTQSSDQSYALVTEDGWLVGYAKVTVAGGTVRVSIEKTIEANVMRYRAWGMFPDATMVKAVSYEGSLPFDQAVKGPGDSCVIVVSMITNYYQGGQNEKFSDALIAPGAGMSYQELNQKMLEMAEQSGE